MEKIIIGNTKYCKIPIIQVNQKGTIYRIGVLDAKFLLDVYTIKPLVYTKENYKYADFDFSDINPEYLIKAIEKERESDFQRIRDEERVKSIKEYLEKEQFALFPNSIIVSAKLKNDFMDNEQIKDPINQRDPDWIETFNKTPGIYYYDNQLYIPETKNSLLIIDGQHRLYGFEDYPKEKEYQLIVSFLLGLDNSVLAQLFYTINYNQKPVNKSLLYHLTSEFSEDLSQIKLLHEFIRIMNESSKSPLQNKIKMLGIGTGFVSQFFLIEMLLPYFLKTREQSNSIPIFLYYYNRDKLQVMIINILMKYFLAIKNLLNRDNNNLWDLHNTIWTKTVGMGALLRILPKVLIALMQKQKILNNPEKINLIKIEHIQDFMVPISNINLESYTGGGSYGLISKLQKEIEKSLNLGSINKDFVSNNIPWLKECYYKK